MSLGRGPPPSDSPDVPPLTSVIAGVGAGAIVGAADLVGDAEPRVALGVAESVADGDGDVLTWATPGAGVRAPGVRVGVGVIGTLVTGASV